MAFGYQILGFGSFPNRGPGAYTPAGALLFDGSADYLARIDGGPASDGKIGTFSCWIKRQGPVGGASANTETIVASGNASGENSLMFVFESSYWAAGDDTLVIGDLAGNWKEFYAGSVFRDPTGWMHICYSFDTTNATATARHVVEVNGVALTSTAHIELTENLVMDMFTAGEATHIGRQTVDTTRHFDGYMADVIGIDGTKYAASNFGETDSTTGIWVPKNPADADLTFGNNGFWLGFDDARYIGKDTRATNPTPQDATLLIHSNTTDDSTTFVDSVGRKTITVNNQMRLFTLNASLLLACLLAEGQARRG